MESSLGCRLCASEPMWTTFAWQIQLDVHPSCLMYEHAKTLQVDRIYICKRSQFRGSGRARIQRNRKLFIHCRVQSQMLRGTYLPWKVAREHSVLDTSCVLPQSDFHVRDASASGSHVAGVALRHQLWKMQKRRSY